MGLINGCAVALPYGFTIDANGVTIRPFNREYGFYARFRTTMRISDRRLLAMSWNGSDSVRGYGDSEEKGRIVWFYNDGCVPFRDDERATDDYVKRLNRFTRLKVHDDDQPRPNHEDLIDAELNAARAKEALR